MGSTTYRVHLTEGLTPAIEPVGLDIFLYHRCHGRMPWLCTGRFRGGVCEHEILIPSQKRMMERCSSFLPPLLRRTTIPADSGHRRALHTHCFIAASQDGRASADNVPCCPSIKKLGPYDDEPSKDDAGRGANPGNQANLRL